MGRTYLDCGCEEEYCQCKVSREYARKNSIRLLKISVKWLNYGIEDDTKPLKTSKELLDS